MQYTKVRLSDLQPLADLLELPSALTGVPLEQRLDASWLGHGFIGVGYFHRVEVKPELTVYQEYGAPSFVVDPVAGTVTYTYPVTYKPLEEVKRLRIQAFNDKRDALYREGFTYRGKVYQIDVEARTDMLAVEAKFQRGEVNPHGGFWRTKDNEMIPMDDEDCRAFLLAAGEYVQSIKATSWDKKDTVAGATTPEEVLSVVW